MARKHPLAICESCPLINSPYLPDKLKDSEYLLIGTRPSKIDVKAGRLFAGATGQIIEAMGGNKYNHTNLISCYDENPPEKAFECCKPRVDALIEKHKGVMVFGTEASKQYLGAPLSDTFGSWDEEGKILANMQPASLFHHADSFPDFELVWNKIEKGKNTSKPPAYFVPKDLTELRELLYSLGEEIAFDIETDYLEWYHRPKKRAALLLNCVFTDGKKTVVVPYNFFYDEQTVKDYGGGPYLREYTNFYDGKDLINRFFGSTRTFIAHNAKFDCTFLWSLGVWAVCDFDTMLAHHILKETPPHDLKSLASIHLDAPVYDVHHLAKVKGKEVEYSRVPKDKLETYAANDVFYTLQLYYLFNEQLEAEPELLWLFYNVAMGLHRVLSTAEFKGILIDMPALLKWEKWLNDRKAEVTKRMRKYVENLLNKKKLNEKEWSVLIKKSSRYSTTTKDMILGKKLYNPGSTQMTGFILFELIGLPYVDHYKLKNTSTSKEGLRTIFEKNWALLDHPFVQLLLLYRRISRMISAYINTIKDNVDNDNRLHDSYRIHGTEIGRLTSSTIMLVPRPDDIFGNIIRSLFIPDPGCVFVDADYSQAEIRMAAVVSNDKYLLQVYKEGRDLHSEVAQDIFGTNFTKAQRSSVKKINFGLQYSVGTGWIKPTIDVSREELVQIAEQREKLTSGYTNFKATAWQEGVRKGYLQTRWGRKRRFPLLTETNKEDVIKSAIHHMVSSSASEGNNYAMVKLSEMGFDVRFGVHDSLYIVAREENAKETARTVEAVMAEVMAERYPEVPWVAEAEITKSWAKPPVFDATIDKQPIYDSDCIRWLPFDIETYRSELD